MFSRDILQKNIKLLLQSINNNLTHYSVTPISNSSNRLYIRGVLIVDIETDGTVYNPICKGTYLGIVFNWLNCIGYDQERINARNYIYKLELIERLNRTYSE